MFVDPKVFVSRIDEILADRVLVTGDQLETVDGRHLSRDYIPTFDRDDYLGHMWVYRDITAMVDVQQQLEAQSITDALTRIANRRGFMQRLTEELRRLERSQRPLSVLMLDVDHFKSFNDEYGHQAGDSALCVLAETLAGEVREVDHISRYGGEEFVVILPGADAETARHIAERIRSAISQSDFIHRRLTVSVGICTVDNAVSPADPGAAMDYIVGEADKALYAAKRAGRNRVVHHADLPTSLP